MLNFQVQEKAGNPGIQSQSGNSMLNSKRKHCEFQQLRCQRFRGSRKEAGDPFHPDTSKWPFLQVMKESGEGRKLLLK